MHDTQPSFVSCSRLPDSLEREKNCVGKTSGGLGRGEVGELVSIFLIFHSRIPAPARFFRSRCKEKVAMPLAFSS